MSVTRSYEVRCGKKNFGNLRRFTVLAKFKKLPDINSDIVSVNTKTKEILPLS